MPRALKAAARRGCSEGYSGGYSGLHGGYSVGTQGVLRGLSGVVGCTFWYPLTGLHARAFAELFGFGALASDAFRFSCRCHSALNPRSIRAKSALNPR